VFALLLFICWIVKRGYLSEGRNEKAYAGLVVWVIVDAVTLEGLGIRNMVEVSKVRQCILENEGGLLLGLAIEGSPVGVSMD
jgi:hypothetical protein